MSQCQLAAIRIERRSLAIALFSGLHLDHARLHNLPSDPEKAEASAIGQVRWLIAHFGVTSVAVEAVHNGDLRKVILTTIIVDTLRAEGVPIFQFEKHELFQSFGQPPLQSRKEVRAVVSQIWPILNNRDFTASVLDAAALGLHVQTERLLTY